MLTLIGTEWHVKLRKYETRYAVVMPSQMLSFTPKQVRNACESIVKTLREMINMEVPIETWLPRGGASPAGGPKGPGFVTQTELGLYFPDAKCQKGLKLTPEEAQPLTLKPEP